MSSTTLLSTARAYLQTPNVPLALRIHYYLRVSCLAQPSKPSAYSRLVRTLRLINPQWLHTCTITEAGTLVSTDPAIQALLPSIQDLPCSAQNG